MRSKSCLLFLTSVWVMSLSAGQVSTALAEEVSPGALARLGALIQSLVQDDEIVGAELLVIKNGTLNDSTPGQLAFLRRFVGIQKLHAALVKGQWDRCTKAEYTHQVPLERSLMGPLFLK